MTRWNRLFVPAGLTGAAALTIAAFAAEKFDRPKARVEQGASSLAGAASAAVKPSSVPLYVTKGSIELPLEEVVSRTMPSGTAFVNPKVEPGKVHWHADLEAACRAAKGSGKPVLYFQMMGKLDQKFC